MPSPIRPTRLLALCVVAVFLLASVAVAQAAETIKLSLLPVGESGSYFNLTMAPGERRELRVQLGNGGTESVQTRTFPADAFSLVNGGFGAKLDGEPTSGTTLWLDYPAETFDLAPGTAIERTFTVSVPSDALPGEYQTSLVLQNADAISGEGATAGVTVAFKQIVRQALAVSITVPGPLTPALQIGAVSQKSAGGNTTVMVQVNNIGNVRLKPYGEFVLHDATGKELNRFPSTMDTVYAGTQTTAEMPFGHILNPGEYRLSAALSDASGATAAPGPLALSVPQPEAAAVAVAPQGAQRATLNQAPATAPGGMSVATWVPVLDVSAVLLIVGSTSMALGLVLVLSGLGLQFSQRRTSLAWAGSSPTPAGRRHNGPAESSWF